MRNILSVVVNNSSGVLSHVIGLFTRRGYNIDSLSVAPTADISESVITIVVNEEDKMIKQIIKQLNKLTDVIAVKNLTNREAFKRELILITVQFHREKRTDFLGLIEAFKATITDMSEDAALIELTGLPRKVQAFLNAMAEFNIIGVARTGSIALEFPTAERLKLLRKNKKNAF